ncbi:MAG: DUF1905 domain-containing protein [Acidimicrobiia bacterium]|nr:DUF1905 domain-containing protein [Acidimicrobiia bacterium]MDH5422278.1 DUF1905 domain-containing protein [Acidimicrobiia bacterium]MDH5503555.1 DUF1905 domain-containing protein [Acidimicrobiia bacterium]
MAITGPTFSFEAELFEADAEAAWVFVALPPADADEIRDLVPRRPGFGSVKVIAKIKAVEWKTSIFPSKEAQSYLLPVKRSVRDSAEIDTGDRVWVTISLV